MNKKKSYFQITLLRGKELAMYELNFRNEVARTD